jgi:hypothetical protein
MTPLDELPKLPVRAAIYVATDGTVHFGALFEELVPVARALGADLAKDRTNAAARDGAAADPGEPVLRSGS